ncbi:hypothetical protein WJX79_005150 [Trebouxia sp. C0005]
MLVCSTPRCHQAIPDAVHSAKQRKRPNSAQCFAPRWRKITIQPRGNGLFSIASRASGRSQDSPLKSAQQLGLWTAIDAAATLGSIAGALAFIITSEALLAGIPIVLPLVAWYAGRQKANLQIEAAITRAAQTWQVQRMSPTAASDSIAHALQQLQKDSQQQQVITKHVKSIEAKLNALEGSVLTAGLNAQEAARQVSTCSDQVAQRTQAQLKDFTASIQSNGLAALQRLDAKLCSVETELAELNSTQKQVLEACDSSLQIAFDHSRQSLQDAEQLIIEHITHTDTQDQLRQLVAEELSQATQKIVAAQAETAQASLPAMDDSSVQKLTRIEHKLQELQAPTPAESAQDASSALHAVHSLLQSAYEEVDPGSSAAKSIAQAQTDLHNLMDKAPAASDQQLNSSLAELQQSQLTIQGGLAALQAAWSKGGLPVDQGSNQEAATSRQEAVLANTESLLDAMEVFQSRLTEQVDSISDKVAQLSAAQSLSPLLANTAGVFDPMPKAVEEAVIRSAESPQEPIQIPADGKESAYERMQVLLQQRNSSNSSASTSGKDDPTLGLPGQSAGPRQQPGNPSGIQEQFMFAAGLAAAGAVPLETTEEQWWDQQSFLDPDSRQDQQSQQPTGQKSQQQIDESSQASYQNQLNNSEEAEPLEVEQMSFAERLQAGRECFRSARNELEGGSLGAASSLMSAALSYYEAASLLDDKDVKLMGSWGNALLAYGGLKKRLLEAVIDAPSPGPIEASAVAASKAQILTEASDALIDAGHKFQSIAQQNIEDTKALTNWAKSICIRASLKDKPEEAMRLYSSAVDKFEKVLAIKPDSVSVLVTCGLALKDMALCMSLDDPDTLINLEDAEICMQQALSIDSSNPGAAWAKPSLYGFAACYHCSK